MRNGLSSHNAYVICFACRSCPVEIPLMTGRCPSCLTHLWWLRRDSQEDALLRGEPLVYGLA